MANKKFQVPVNLVNLASDPGTASEGDIYYNTVSDTVRVYANGSWIAVGSGGGSASDSFKTISVTGQDSVVADSSTDTLSLVAGTNVSITTDATADSITINSTGNYTSVDSIAYPDYITFDTTPETEPTAAGSLWWNPDFETLNVQLDSAVTLQVGQEHVVRVKNDSGSVAIPEMRVVMFAGATGDTVEVTPALSTSSYEPELLLGITTEQIPADGFGFVTQFGFINKVDTSTPGWSLGDLLYVDPANAGLLTNVKPSAPNWTFPVAAVTRVHASTGRILVRALPGKHLHDLVDVAIDSPADNEVLAYNSGSGVWINQTASEAGLATSSHNHTLDSLSNVVIEDVADKESIVWDSASSKWVNLDINLPSQSENDGKFLTTDGTSASWEDISLTYLAISDALDTYLTIDDASATYATTESLGDYLSIDSAASTYQPIGSYLVSSDLSGYLTSETASTTYAPLVSASLTTPSLGAATATSINSTTIPTSKTLLITEDISISVQAYSATLAGINTLGVGTGFLKNTAGTWSYDNSTYLTTGNASSTYQPLDQDLTDISALSANGFLKKTAGVWAMDSSTYITSEVDTLSSVTGRGATTSSAISITNTTQSTTPTTGALIISGGLGVSKDVWIDGDLHVNGSTATLFSRSLSTRDNLIYLNESSPTEITNAVGDGTYVTYTADNDYLPGESIRITGIDPAGYNISSGDLKTIYSATDTQFVVEKTTTGTYVSGGDAYAKSAVNPDLGFAGGYNDGTYAHAGLFRDASDGVFKFFKGYTPEPDAAVNIDTTDVSFELADISANDATFTGNVTVDEVVLKTTSTPLTSAAATTYDTIATIPIPVGKEVVSAECLVLLSSTDDATYYTSKCLIFGGTVAGDPVADITEYAIMGDMAATLTTAKAGSNIELRVAVTDYTGVTAKVVSTAISADNGAA